MNDHYKMDDDTKKLIAEFGLDPERMNEFNATAIMILAQMPYPFSYFDVMKLIIEALPKILPVEAMLIGGFVTVMYNLQDEVQAEFERQKKHRP